LPAKPAARRAHLKTLQSETRTLIFYESPHRLLSTLADFATILGEGRQLSLAKEITKQYETFFLGTIKEVIDWLEAEPVRQKGEFVLIVAGNLAVSETAASIDHQMLLEKLLLHVSLKTAVEITASLTATSKKQIYQAALDYQSRSV